MDPLTILLIPALQNGVKALWYAPARWIYRRHPKIAPYIWNGGYFPLYPIGRLLGRAVRRLRYPAG